MSACRSVLSTPLTSRRVLVSIPHPTTARQARAPRLLTAYIGPTGDAEMPPGLHRLATLATRRRAKVAATERAEMDRIAHRKGLTAPVTHHQDITGLAVRRNPAVTCRLFRRGRRRRRSRLNVTHHAVLAGRSGFGPQELHRIASVRGHRRRIGWPRAPHFGCSWGDFHWGVLLRLSLRLPLSL